MRLQASEVKFQSFAGPIRVFAGELPFVLVSPWFDRNSHCSTIILAGETIIFWKENYRFPDVQPNDR